MRSTERIMAKKLDKYPNYMTGTVTQSAADTATVSQFSTPIPRLQTRGNKATVMELLWIDFNVDIKINATVERVRWSVFGGQTTTSDVLVSDPRGIAFMGFSGDTLVTEGACAIGERFYYDLTSKDGFGYLFAGDAINLLVTSANTAVANVVGFRIYYRFVEIPITEFVGLVQSQQQSTS